MDSQSHPACYSGKENQNTDSLAVGMDDVNASQSRLVHQSQAEASKTKTDILNSSSPEISEAAPAGDVVQESLQSKDESLPSSGGVCQQRGEPQKSQLSGSQFPLPLSPCTAAEGQNVSEESGGLVAGASDLPPSQTSL